MRDELSDDEWAIVRPMLPNKARGVLRADAHAAATNIDALLARADEALYAATSAERNRVEAELSHVDAPPAAPQPAAAQAPADNTVAWSSYRRPRGTAAGRQAA